MLPYYGTDAFYEDRYDNTENGWQWVDRSISQNAKYYPKYVSSPWYSIFSQDFNGDGLIDFLQDSDLNYQIIGGNPIRSYTTILSLNKGGYFQKNQNKYHTNSGVGPYSYTPDFTGNNDHFMMDINGDGLPDFVYALYSPPQCGYCQPIYTHKVYINTGSTWQLDTGYVLPQDFAYHYNLYNGNINAKMDIADFNSDGLQDIMIPNRAIYINQGKSFYYKPLSSGIAGHLGDLINREMYPYLVFDFDADGDPDIFLASQPVNSGRVGVFLNTNDKPNDLLVGVREHSGSSFDIEYKTSHLYKDSSGNLLNPNLSVVLNTVSSVRTNDGLGNVATTKYEYA
jgi:hypothetical protein